MIRAASAQKRPSFEFRMTAGPVHAFGGWGVGVGAANSEVPGVSYLAGTGALTAQATPTRSAWGPTATGDVGALFTVNPYVDLQVGGEIAAQNIYAGNVSPIWRGFVGLVFLP